MDDPQPLPLWMIPLFPLFFAGMWMLVLTIISAAGWNALARLYREPEGMARDPVASFRTTSIDLRGGFPLPANYSNCVIVEVARAGLHLRVWLPFRFRHPPLLIPWARVERFERGRFLFWRTLTLHPRGTNTRIRLYGGPARAVEEVARQIAAPAAEPARV